jgi:hypothetical protein
MDVRVGASVWWPCFVTTMFTTPPAAASKRANQIMSSIDSRSLAMTASMVIEPALDVGGTYLPHRSENLAFMRCSRIDGRLDVIRVRFAGRPCGHATRKLFEEHATLFRTNAGHKLPVFV